MDASLMFFPKLGEKVVVSNAIYKVINIYRPRQNDVLHYDVKDISTGRLRTVFRHMMGPESPEVQVKIEKNPDYSPEFAPLNTATLNTSWDDEELDTFLSFIDSKYEPTENVVSVPIKKARFASATESTIAEASASVNEKTTVSSTKWGVKVLKEWLVEKEEDVNFEQYPDNRLNETLRRFSVEARTSKGENYSKMSLLGIRAALNRHLKSPPFERVIDLSADSNFQTSNQVLKGLIKIQKRAGLDITKHKESINPTDMKKMYSTGVLANVNPTSLQRKVWFEITLHFGRRGQEGLSNLRKSSFMLKKDADGCNYYTMAYNEADKTHHGCDSREKSKSNRMYATPENPEFCPVESLTKYLSKLHPDCASLFQRKRILDDDNCEDVPVWYVNKQMGHNKLGSMMADISTASNLSQRYTNHCVRATCCTILGNSGISSANIMSISGHRNEKSLQSYIAGPSVAQKRSMSNVLQNEVTGNSNTLSIIEPTPPQFPFPAIGLMPDNFPSNQSQSTTSSCHTGPAQYTPSTSRQPAFPGNHPYAYPSVHTGPAQYTPSTSRQPAFPENHPFAYPSVHTGPAQYTPSTSRQPAFPGNHPYAYAPSTCCQLPHGNYTNEYAPSFSCQSVPGSIGLNTSTSCQMISEKKSSEIMGLLQMNGAQLSNPIFNINISK